MTEINVYLYYHTTDKALYSWNDTSMGFVHAQYRMTYMNVRGRYDI